MPHLGESTYAAISRERIGGLKTYRPWQAARATLVTLCGQMTWHGQNGSEPTFSTNWAVADFKTLFAAIKSAVVHRAPIGSVMAGVIPTWAQHEFAFGHDGAGIFTEWAAAES